MRRRDLRGARWIASLEVYNSAWKRNWGFVPLTEEEVRDYAEGDAARLRPELGFMVAEKDGETVGVAITVPDVNQVLTG